MKIFRLFLFSLVIMGYSVPTYAHKRKKENLSKTEAELMNKLLSCFQNKDTIGYYNLFPPFDTLWRMVMHNTNRSPEAIEAINELKEHPRAIIEFDPYFNPNIIGKFCFVMQKGEDSGVHWKNTTLYKFELQKQPITRELVGYDYVCPERFTGYMFLRDVTGRQTFCMSIAEIQKINGYFVGGQVHNILVANTIDQFLKKQEAERYYYANKKDIDAQIELEKEKQDSIRNDSLNRLALKEDSLKDKIAANDTTKAKDTLKTKGRPNFSSTSNYDEDGDNLKKIVVARMFYEGKFDDEIPVEMFVRYLKDVVTGKVTYWDGLYKFGDQDFYNKLEITKSPDGKWLFDDDPPVGSMELVLKDKTYTGTWVNNENQSGYDVVLKQSEAEPKKIEDLDNILEKGTWGRNDDVPKTAKEEYRKESKKSKRSERKKRKEKADKQKKDENQDE